MTDDQILDAIADAFQAAGEGVLADTVFLAALRDAGYDVVPAEPEVGKGWMILRRRGNQAGPFATEAEAEPYLQEGDIIIPVAYRRAGVERP